MKRRTAFAARREGLERPTGTPELVIALLSECLAEPALRERMEQGGVELARPPQTTPAWFAAFLRADLARTREAVRLAGIKVE